MCQNFLPVFTPILHVFPMKYSAFFGCLLLSLLVACGPDNKTARVTGTIDGIDQADFMIYAADAVEGDGGSLDSVKVNRGSFTYDRPTTAPLLLTLVYPNNSFTTFIAQPGAEVSLSGSANRLKEIEVVGTDDNKMVSEFRQSVLPLNEKDAQMRAATFVRTHPETWAAVAIFYQYFDRVEERHEQPTLDLLNLLKKHQPNNQQLLAIDARLRPQLQTSVGAHLPKFSATTLSKGTLQSADFKGQPTLLVFSAGWDNHNYALRQQLRRIKATRGQRIRIINFALDETEQKASDRAKNDSLSSVVYLKGMLANPLVKTLGMRYPSGCILTNPDGRIIARDIPTDKLADRVLALIH